MKVNELMIGDWCRMRRCDIPDAIFYTSKVLCLQKDGFLEYEPIPLTEEILEKNGFQSSSDGKSIAYFSEEDEPLFTISIRQGGYWIPISWYGKGLILKYVHELQQALRLCGLTELADNFKV